MSVPLFRRVCVWWIIQPKLVMVSNEPRIIATADIFGTDGFECEVREIGMVL
jgi:hypothetical protein